LADLAVPAACATPLNVNVATVAATIVQLTIRDNIFLLLRESVPAGRNVWRTRLEDRTRRTECVGVRRADRYPD
jgi:hypothetical protein